MNKGGTPENLKPFKPGQSGNPKGRAKSSVRIICDQYKADGHGRVSVADVKEVYEVLLGLTRDEIFAIANDTKQPILFGLVAKEIIGKKGAEMLERLLDRAHGKATQALDHTTGGEPIQRISTDELIRIAAKLQPGTNSGTD